MRDDRTLDTQTTPGDRTDRSDDIPSTDRRTTFRASAAYARNLLHGPALARVALATGVLCCLGLAAVAQTQGESADAAARGDALTARAEATQRVEQDRPSRDADRAATSATSATPAADPDTDTRPTRKPRPVDPAPVAGLTEAQMENAEAIVRTGREMGVPRRALVIAVATAMQESNLYNYASGVLPESQNYPHQAIGWDHDSVGLFQQRPSSGWGPVRRLMEPEFATRQFLSALEQVPGWQRMRLTDAAQAVQISAYPEHYAKHEWRATKVVEAIVPNGK
ncbi:peptidase M23 [Micromonospora echinaurantiaca]|uniref:peptidase M23 n=1 Tax=Micromonospora echinaurantiaca TaxID=47857 RepID=UPI0037B55CC9